MDEKNAGRNSMTGSRSFAERMDGIEDQDNQQHRDVGLKGLGAQMSNTQILEQEMMGDSVPAETKLDEEDIEIDMMDDDDEGIRLEDEDTSPKKFQNDNAALFGIDTPKRSDFKRADGSRSPKKAPYADLSHSTSSQSSKTGPPLPPKHGIKSMTTDPNVRQAFRSHKPVDEMSMEEMERETKAYDNGQILLKSQRKRPPTLSGSDDEFESADDGPESTLKERLKASKTESEILRNEVFMLKKELKETQDFVFSMQPRAQGLTESEALADYNSLCGGVRDWVESKLLDSIEAMLEGKQKITFQTPVKIFLASTPPAGREAFRYDNTDEHNIIAYIMRCLFEWVLNREFYCTIEGGAQNFLHSVEKAMRNLEPRRDHITCRTWRSETYTAITNKHNFAGFRDKLRQQVAYDLVHTLHPFAPRLDQDMLGASLLSSVIDPCLNLAHKLSLSVDKYTLRWTPFHTATWEQRQTMKLDLTQFECVDLIGGRTFKTQPKGKLFTYICDLAPGLVLEKAQAQFNGEPKILKKPRILVAVTKEEDGFYSPKIPKQGEPCTVLGWMEEKLQTRNRFAFG